MEIWSTVQSHSINFSAICDYYYINWTMPCSIKNILCTKKITKKNSYYIRKTSTPTYKAHFTIVITNKLTIYYIINSSKIKVNIANKYGDSINNESTQSIHSVKVKTHQSLKKNNSRHNKKMNNINTVHKNTHINHLPVKPQSSHNATPWSSSMADEIPSLKSKVIQQSERYKNCISITIAKSNNHIKILKSQWKRKEIIEDVMTANTTKTPH